MAPNLVDYLHAEVTMFKHGQAVTGKVSKKYVAWANMKARCDNPNALRYSNYGGRGITYDPSWKDFKNFDKDVADPQEGLSLDRKDNDGNYVKENVHWVNENIQQSNRSNNAEWLGVRGRGNSFQAQIKHQGNRYCLGSFSSPEEAHLMYLVSREALWLDIT